MVTESNDLFKVDRMYQFNNKVSVRGCKEVLEIWTEVYSFS